MKFIISIVFALATIGCHQNYEFGKNLGDIYSKEGQLVYLLLKSLNLGGGSSSAQPGNIFGFSDRIIIVPNSSWNSTNLSIWVSTDGTTFTKTSVKVGDCVGSSSGSGTTYCGIMLAGYENGKYAFFGQKSQSSSGGNSSVTAQYFGTATDLSSGITLSSTSPGANINTYSTTFIYSGGKFHVYSSGSTSAIYTTTDGSSWSPVTGGFSCYKMFAGDGGTLTCGLSKYYNGSTWTNAGTITGGGSNVTSSTYVTYLNSAYYAYPSTTSNNVNTYNSLYVSTAGTISSGLTFPASANATLSIKANPANAVKNSSGVYFIATSTGNSSPYTTYLYKSSDASSWSAITPSYPTDIGTLERIQGFATLGNTFYLVAAFKSGSITTYYLLQSTDGQTWTKVTLE